MKDKKIRNKEKCFVKEDRFGWREYDHYWAYIDKEHRVCPKCNERELLFGLTENGEDWRPAI